MALDAEGVVERRRLRRRAGMWRLMALFLLVAFIVAAGWKATGAGTAGAHVARVSLTGLILDSDERQKMFERLEKSRAQAVILEIDSPGGGVTASEELYDDIRELAEKKPVVAVLGSVAASGGYIAAIAADRIIAHETSLTGSIGVLVQYPNFSKLLADLGVNVEEVKSAPLKASPNMFTPTSEEARRALQDVVLDSFAWFKRLVGERRKLDVATVDRVSDGRVFTGRQALAAGLVDELGGEDEARAWLASAHKVSKDLPVRDWEPEENSLEDWGLARHLAAAVVEEMGLRGLAQQIRGPISSAAEIHSLDGLLAIWHPSLYK